VDPARVVYHGRSLGGGVAAGLAAVQPPAALVLECTFTSLASFAPRFLAPPFLIRHPFRVDRALRGFTRPTLILHGTDDEIIPVSHGRRLHALLPGSAYAEMPARHNDFPTDWDAYERAVRTHLRDAGIIPGD